MGTCHPQDPFFRPNFSSRDQPFQAFFLLRRPHLDFLKKILHFKTTFCRFLAPETHTLAKICSGDPSFKPKISSRDNSFESPGGTYPRHIPTQIFGDYPLRGDFPKQRVFSGANFFGVFLWSAKCQFFKYIPHIIFRYFWQINYK